MITSFILKDGALSHLNPSFDIFPKVSLQTPTQRPEETAITYWTMVLFSTDK